MAPYRNPEREQAATSSHPYASTSTLSASSARKSSAASQGNPGSVPTGSLSKLKAQLRQTKRLLTREDLTPDVKITSERRLKTLELEIVKATQGALEQKMVTKYRGVKFFERKKVLRKIEQAKKALLAKADDATAQATLLDSRIDLYYILRYSKTDKYTSLFPEGTYVPHTAPTATTIAIPGSAPTKKAGKKDPAATRAALRQAIREQIAAGTLEMEAEGGELGIEGEEDVKVNGAKDVAVEEKDEDVDMEDAAVEVPVQKVKKVKKDKKIAVEDPVAAEEPVVVSETKREKKKKSKKAQSVPVAVDEVVEEPVEGKEGWVAEGDDFFA